MRSVGVFAAGRTELRRYAASLAALGAVLLTAGLFGAWVAPSDDFLYLPNDAKPVAANVAVDGRPDSGGEGGIYYVDVSVRPARWLEHVVPWLRPDGASLVAGERVTASGESLEERQRKGVAEMNRSERVAAAVALREAGLRVTAIARGVLVESVAIDVPAAGVLEDGDVIVAAAGRETKTPAGLRAAISPLVPGASVALRVRRDGRALVRTVATVESPVEPGRAMIGVRVGQDATIRLPVDVEIDLGDVGGPSAGLPFALEVLKELGRDVDRGNRVAATGELALDGTVLPVGGLKQKTLGARAAGVDVFLVPAGENANEALRYAGSLRVIPVESFQQALRALRTLSRK